MEIKNLTYHRNGIGGTGFFSLRYDWKDYSGIERRMLATIERNGEDDGFDYTSCRVMDIDNPDTSWRGDSESARIIYQIEKHYKMDGIKP